MTHQNGSGAPISPQTTQHTSGWGIARHSASGEPILSQAMRCMCEVASTWDPKRDYDPVERDGMVAMKVSTSNSENYIIFETVQAFQIYMEGVLDTLGGPQNKPWQRRRRR